MKKTNLLLVICLLAGMLLGCNSTENGGWKNTYAGFLKDKVAEYSGEPRFELCYITEDDIPEIVIMHGTSQMSGARIYTYYDGRVVEFTRGGSGGMTYGEWGAIWYKEKEGLIYERNYTDKDDPHYQHIISYVHDDYMTDYKFELADHYGTERFDKQGNYITTRYEADGSPVDEAEYLRKCDEYGINDIDTIYKKVEYGNMPELNEKNIDKCLK